jgi:hypothetical protein
MSAEIDAVTFKLSTSRACDFVGAASARAVATTLTIACLLGLVV